MDLLLRSATPASSASIWAAWILALWACSTVHIRGPLARLAGKARAS